MITALAVLGAVFVVVYALAAAIRLADWLYSVRLRLRRYEAARSAAREALDAGKSYDEQARAAYEVL